MTTWKVLRNESEKNGLLGAWWEVGTHESTYSYTPGYDAAQTIGEAHGAGEYLLLGENNNFYRLTIAARQEFYEVTPEEPAEDEEPPRLSDERTEPNDTPDHFEGNIGANIAGMEEGSTLEAVLDPRD